MKTALKRMAVGMAFGFCLLISAVGIYGQKVVTAGQVNGTWRDVTSKNAGVSSEFKVLALGNQKLQIEFFGNNAAKKVSNMEKGEVMIDGTTAVFKPADAQGDEKNPCVMTLKFAGAQLVVTQKGECGFGAGIGAAGTYKKISAAKPKFDEDN